MSILDINRIALELVARDFSDGHMPTNGGPTKTSRALAIIHLAAHDAYAKVTGQRPPQLATLPNPPAGLGSDDATGTDALIGAGIHAAQQLYPDSTAYIAVESANLVATANPQALLYGEQIADFWINERKTDGSALPQMDGLYDSAPGRHRPDPLVPGQQTLGRKWGQVKPFALSDVATETLLAPPPALNTAEYAEAFDHVFVNGRNNTTLRSEHFRHQAAVGIFWGYDGSNKLGTPPRLYNQVILNTQDFIDAAPVKQIQILTAINVAMADAGIAAWYWKYTYDFWRPVVAIREAEKGWGPTGHGDGNQYRQSKGDPFWLPLGAPKSNPILPKDPVLPAAIANFTPNFPAYPSGHATFGTACFETAASLLGKTPEQISVTMVSDEFNGKTTDNTGATRPNWEATFTLREAIEQNKISRIYLGVHWAFDATGGESVGHAVAQKVIAAFP